VGLRGGLDAAEKRKTPITAPAGNRMTVARIIKEHLTSSVKRITSEFQT